MQFKEHDKVTIKVSNTDSITGEIVHASEALKHYYVSAGKHSGYYEEHELESLYPLQQGVTYFNVDQFQGMVNTVYKAQTIKSPLEDAPSEPEKSTTGSLRYNTGKPQTNEISPEFILDMGRVLAKSREKYPRANWSLGNNYSVPYDSLMRHLLSWQSGEKNDIESGYSHLAHAALNLMMLHYYEERFPELDDRIFKKETK